MKCFYHTDMDGHCAGAIVRKAFDYGGDYFSINYNQSFPFEEIKPEEQVVIVDFSLQKEGEFDKLLQITPNVIWIDHHKTAIEKHTHLDTRLNGLRRDGISGCELTWEFFFSEEPVPDVVRLLGDYDIWAFKFGEKTNFLQNGIRLFDTRPESELWRKWLDPYYDLAKELEMGEIALQYRNNHYKGLIKAWSYETTFEGFKAIACNAGSVSSQLFDSVTENYDLMIPFVFDGKQWTVSLYTKKEDLDVSVIAKKFGGGGHKAAAGFQCKELPFLLEES